MYYVNTLIQRFSDLASFYIYTLPSSVAIASIHAHKMAASAPGITSSYCIPRSEGKSNISFLVLLFEWKTFLTFLEAS